jgi:hypothetical protein
LKQKRNLQENRVDEFLATFYTVDSDGIDETVFSASMMFLPREGEVISYCFLAKDKHKWNPESWRDGVNLHGTRWKVIKVNHEVRKYEVMKPESHVIFIQVEQLKEEKEESEDKRDQILKVLDNCIVTLGRENLDFNCVDQALELLAARHKEGNFPVTVALVDLMKKKGLLEK